jgi:hypothetical protein
VQTEDGRNLHVYSTYLHWRDVETRRKELEFNRQIIEKEGLDPHVYVGDWQLSDIGSPELDPLREAGYVGCGNGPLGLWVPEYGVVQLLASAPVENEWTSISLSPGETVGASRMPLKAVLRVRGAVPTPEERCAAMRDALNLTEDSLRAAETALAAETRPIHAPDILRQLVVDENQYRRMSLVPVARPEFQLALRIETKEQPENSWDVAVGARTVRPIAKGDAVVATFWVRAVPVPGAGLPGRMTFRFQETKPPWRGPTVEFHDIGEEWTRHRLIFTVPDNYRPGEGQFRFHCGHKNQVLEIGGLQVVNCRDLVPLADLVAMVHYEDYVRDLEDGA